MKLEVGNVLVKNHHGHETLVEITRTTEKRAYVHFGISGEHVIDKQAIQEGPVKPFGEKYIRFRIATPDDIARIQEKEKKAALMHYIEAASRTNHTLEALLIAANALGYKEEQ